jgi:hypothetical protein
VRKKHNGDDRAVKMKDVQFYRNIGVEVYSNLQKQREARLREVHMDAHSPGSISGGTDAS